MCRNEKVFITAKYANKNIFWGGVRKSVWV